MGIFKGDGHLLLGGREGFTLHGDAAKVFRLVVDGSPLAGQLVDDEEPLVCAGQGVDGVGSGGDGGGAGLGGGSGYEGGGLGGSGGPDLAIGGEVAPGLGATQGGGVGGAVDG